MHQSNSTRLGTILKQGGKTYKVMKYWVAELLAAEDVVLEATVDVWDVEALVVEADEVVCADDVVVAAADVVEPTLVAVAGTHWSGVSIVSSESRELA